MNDKSHRLNGPDFIIAGGHKCGTTSLHAMLSGHPDIEMSSIKEPHFLARSICEGRLHGGVWSPAEYERTWSEYGSRVSRGEASVLYLTFAAEVCSAIDRELMYPPKVIVSIRNPIERARSSYLDTRLKNPDEDAPTFEAAVAREIANGPWRLDGPGSPTLHHLALGRYSEGIKYFQAHLGKENVLVILFEDFISRPSDVMASIQAFIGVTPSRLDISLRRNEGGAEWGSRLTGSIMRSPGAVAVRRLLRHAAPRVHRRLARVAHSHLTVRAPPISPSVRAQLISLYEDEVASLQELCGRPLSHWLER